MYKTRWTKKIMSCDWWNLRSLNTQKLTVLTTKLNHCKKTVTIRNSDIILLQITQFTKIFHIPIYRKSIWPDELRRTIFFFFVIRISRLLIQIRYPIPPDHKKLQYNGTNHDTYFETFYIIVTFGHGWRIANINM